MPVERVASRAPVVLLLDGEGGAEAPDAAAAVEASLVEALGPAFDSRAIRVERASGDMLALPNASVAAAVVAQSFEPADPVRLLSELHRVLVSDGVLVASPAAGARTAGATTPPAAATGWRAMHARSALFGPFGPGPSAGLLVAPRRGGEPGRDGVVAFVNTSPGGVPKRPVDGAWVEPLGVQGDGHVYPGHGGLDAAVCLLAQEAIERIRADGHDLFPGATGENATVLGLDWPALRAGDRLELGSGLVLELTDYATPCRTIAHWFERRRIARIGQKTNPGDARWYARVLAEGRLEPGDGIVHAPRAG